MFEATWRCAGLAGPTGLRVVEGASGLIGAEAVGRRDDGPARCAPDPGVFQQECLDGFVASQVAQGFSQITIDNGTGVLERFLALAGKPAWEITEHNVDGVIAALVKRGVTQTTRRGYVQTFRGFFGFLQARKAVEIEALFGGGCRTNDSVRRARWDSGMPQNFIDCDREQVFLMPPSLRDWLPGDHLAWFVIEAVGRLDLAVFYSAYRADGHGRAAYDPSMMVGLVLYAYSTNERSARGIERHCRQDIAYRVITGNCVPDHATVARFIVRHQQRLAELFTSVLRLCARAGLVDAGIVAVDGTKITASASSDSNVDYDRIAREIIAEAIATDEAEDREHGEARGDELPPELQTEAGRREWLERELARERSDGDHAGGSDERSDEAATRRVRCRADRSQRETRLAARSASPARARAVAEGRLRCRARVLSGCVWRRVSGGRAGRGMPCKQGI